MKPWAWPGLGTAAMTAAVFGCGGPQAEDRPSAKAQYPNHEALGADKLERDEANLILAGTKIPVAIRQERDGDRYKILVRAFDQTLEEESYRISKDEFLFEHLSGERFEPPIPIVRFPLTVGDKWDWTGDAFLGPLSRPASATVSTANDKLNLASGNLETVRVVVDLTVKTGRGTMADRKLQFWIKPRAGVVRREFGSSSLREPRAAEDSDSSER